MITTRHEHVSTGISLHITGQLSDHLLALFLPGPGARAIDIQQESQHLTVVSVTMVTMDLLCGEILAAKHSNSFYYKKQAHTHTHTHTPTHTHTHTLQ